LDQKPISDLGFDPILSHPTFEEFKELIGKKKGTVKGVIMDQAFSAGVGNVSDHNVFSKSMLMISGWPMSETHRI
jgi:formamidopyrimidine-DNA glycosylase